MYFRRSLAAGFQSPFTDHVVRERVSLFRFKVRPKCAENTAINADIRRVQVNVGVVVRIVAVLAFPHRVCQLTERQHINLIFEKQAVFEREPFSGMDFFFDGGKT